MLKALLVDDEENNLDNLAFLLDHDCEGIEVAGKVTSGEAARKWLASHHADVVFLDIQMAGENGFEFLASIKEPQFKVVFVTAFDQYALQAIKSSAIDYLLKPVNVGELQNTVGKLVKEEASAKNPAQNQELLQHLLQKIAGDHHHTKLALPQLGGIIFIGMDDIVSLQADSNYTIIHKTDMQKLVITKTLKDFEELLNPDQFCRIHKSYIVNLKHITEYNSADGGMVKMSDGNEWSISRRQLDGFLDKMKYSSLMFPK